MEKRNNCTVKENLIRKRYFRNCSSRLYFFKLFFKKKM